MSYEINWNDLQIFSNQVSQSGESPGTSLDSDWERVRLALNELQGSNDLNGIIKLRELFTGLLARDSAWGIPIIQTLDTAAIDAARQLNNYAELGHLLGARGHNLHRQGYHKQAIIAFEESNTNYTRIGEKFKALKSYYMTSLCYRALNNKLKSRLIITNVLQQIDIDDPWRGNPLQVLAWLTQDEGDLQKAEKLLNEALTLHGKAPNSDILIAQTFADLGEVVSLSNRIAEGNQFFQQSLIILDRYKGQYDRQEARTKLKYAELLRSQKKFIDALRLLDEADDEISGYGHYYDLMWRIELSRCLVFAQQGRIPSSLLKAQMTLRYRRLLGLSNWELIKQLILRFLAKNGLPR
jgi:hypothetical protein